MIFLNLFKSDQNCTKLIRFYSSSLGKEETRTPTSWYDISFPDFYHFWCPATYDCVLFTVKLAPNPPELTKQMKKLMKYIVRYVDE